CAASRAAPGNDERAHRAWPPLPVGQIEYDVLLWARRSGIRAGLRDRPPGRLSRSRDGAPRYRGQLVHGEGYADLLLHRCSASRAAGAAWLTRAARAAASNTREVSMGYSPFR